jgi:asparagine N-glycosylation enzyme membrane subunit Stt3
LKKQDIPILITASLTFIFLVAAVLGQTENDTRNMLIITMVFAGVSVLILVARGAPQPAAAPAANPAAAAAAPPRRLIKSVVWLFLGSGIALIIAIILSNLPVYS